MYSLREFICFNQKELIRFEYIISKLHSDFKEAFLKKEEVEEKYQTLIVESFILLGNIYKKNFEFVRNTFGLFDKDIRMTIKMIDGDEVIDIYRSKYEELVFGASIIEENSGFNEILSKKSSYYLNDDIEKSFLEGKYKNPRLDEKCAAKLKEKKVDFKECWKKYREGLNDYYNSTLIIPMSITMNEEDKDSIFYNDFLKRDNQARLRVDEKLIWGFFCLDSKKKNFFSAIDMFDAVDLGFVIADILSLYLIFFYNYTSGSEIVNKFLEEEG